MADTRNSTYWSYDYFKMHSQKLAAAYPSFNILPWYAFPERFQATTLYISRSVDTPNDFCWNLDFNVFNCHI